MCFIALFFASLFFKSLNIELILFSFLLIGGYYLFICTVIVCEGIGLFNVLYNLVTEKNIFASKRVDFSHFTFFFSDGKNKTADGI